MIIDNCYTPIPIPSQTHLFAFQPLSCGFFYDQCGEAVDCPPLDAEIDKINGGFEKKNWLHHVVYFILNSDSQDAGCNILGNRRGAASDGFVDSLKHGNTLWNSKGKSTSRENIKDYVAIIKDNLTAKLKVLGLALNVKVEYKMTGAYRFDLNIIIDDNKISLSRDVRNSYFNWTA